MYPNVRAELARKHLTLQTVSKELGISASTLSGKLNEGKITLREAKKIKTLLGVDMSIEELFEEAG